MDKEMSIQRIVQEDGAVVFRAETNQNMVAWCSEEFMQEILNSKNFKESSLMCSQNKPTEEKIKEYLSYDPFYGEEADLTCRTLKIVKARKDHVCFSLDGKQDHNINKGDYYRYEKALVDGDFFGTYRLCLNCIDKFMKEEDEDEG